MKNKITIANGETIAYLEQGNGPKVLVLIHGNLSSSVYFRPLIDRLPKTIRVIAPDLRGFGDSTYNHPFQSLRDLADDINMFLNALMIDKAVIAGWSLGGGVAMEFAAAYPKRTEKLILINSTTHKGYPIFKKNASYQPIAGEIYVSAHEMASDPVQVKPVLDAIAAKNAAFMSYIYDLTIYTKNKPSVSENVEYINETMKQQNLPDADYALATLNMSREPNFYTKGSGTIENIQCPVLHFWGTLDKTVPEYMVQDNIKALEKQSQYIKFEECGHSPLVDKPDALTQAILSFIQ